MDEYDMTTDGWAQISFGCLGPSYTPFPLPKSPFPSQEDSGHKCRRSVVDNNNDGPQLLSQSLSSPNEQPNRKRRRSVVGNNNDSPPLFPQSLASPHEQTNRKRRRLVVDNNNDHPQLFPQSLPFPNEQPNRKSPPKIFVNKDYDTVEAHERKDESETLSSDWLAASRATSAGEHITILFFGHGLYLSQI